MRALLRLFLCGHHSYRFFFSASQTSYPISPTFAKYQIPCIANVFSTNAMNHLRLLLTAIIMFLTPLDAAETLKINGREASSTSLVAKIKSVKGSEARVAKALSSSPHVSAVKGFGKIPSVVVINLKSSLKKAAIPTAASDKAAASELVRRMAELQATGLFEYVEPDYVVRPNNLPSDAAFGDGRLWGLRNQGQNGGVAGADIDAPAAWQTTTGSSDVIVAVIDTGIRYTHTDLSANMWVNPGEIAGNGLDDDGNGFIDDIHGINAVNGSGDPMDTDGHGSHCAGTIGAVANGGGPHVGVAWNVRLMALKFLDPSGLTSDAIKCIDYAISKGADIMSNSWGGGGFSQALADAIERANADGILFVAAAGNSGTDNDQQPHYPSNYANTNVVAVAALDRSDNLASFSCFGATTVDLGAPGVSIFSCTSASDTSYDFYDGTSMATPHVSGVAALLKSHFPSAGATELKQRLLQSARPISALLGKSVSGGALDAAQALALAEDGILELNVSTTPAPLRAGATVVITVGVSDLNAVTGAAVTGTFAAQGPLTFADNGTFPDATANDAIYSAQFNVPQTTADSLALTLNVSAAGKQPVNEATFNLQIVRPPANDNFADRIALQSGTTTVTGSNVESSSEVGEPINPSDAGGKTVWWSYMPGISGQVTVTTMGSNYDTTLAIYQGSSLSDLSLLGSNDDTIDNLQSSVTFFATAGTQYLLQVDGYDGETGQIVLNYPDPVYVEEPPAITEQPSDQRVIVGQTIYLNLVASNAVSYQWYFEDSEIPGATNPDLVIRSASLANTGGYRCDISNAYGTTPSSEAFVTVESGYLAGYNDGYSQGYSDGQGGGYADAIYDLTTEPTLAASYGLHTTDAIMEMNLGGIMTHINAGNIVLRLQLETSPDLTQPFVDYGEPVEMQIPMQGEKQFMRIRALGGQ
jgi:subtilisin family serine protease